MAALDAGFATAGLRARSCHDLSAYSVLPCSPDVGSGSQGKTLWSSPSFSLEPSILRQVRMLGCDAKFTYNVREK